MHLIKAAPEVFRSEGVRRCSLGLFQFRDGAGSIRDELWTWAAFWGTKERLLLARVRSFSSGKLTTKIRWVIPEFHHRQKDD